MFEYNSWEQVAGYFDGDGTISLSDTSNQPYKLSLSLIFVDQSYDQIRNVREFMLKRGLRTSNVLRVSKANAYMVAVSQFASVKEVLNQFLPLLYKKANEARAALDYYENKITGNELVEVFQQEVEAGRRERRKRKVPINVPYVYSEGDRQMKSIRNVKLKDALGRFRAKVTAEDFRQIRDYHLVQGVGLRELGEMYPKYSRTTIRRILGRDRRRSYLLVKERGRVTTTDSR